MPNIGVVYREVWQDGVMIVVRMDEHQHTLRRWIGHTYHLTEGEWLAIMLGIIRQLAVAHNYNVAHKDIKPSNSLWAPET